jgi:hypothetical protein
MIAAKLKKFLSEYVPENELGEDGRPIYKYVEMLVSVYFLQRRFVPPSPAALQQKVANRELRDVVVELDDLRAVRFIPPSRHRIAAQRGLHWQYEGFDDELIRSINANARR